MKTVRVRAECGLMIDSNSNSYDNVYSAVSRRGTATARVHPVHLTNVACSVRWLSPGGCWPFGPSRWARANRLTYRQLWWLHSPSQFIATQPKSWYSVYHPMEGRRMSRPSWLVSYRDGLPARRHPPIQVLTRHSPTSLNRHKSLPLQRAMLKRDVVSRLWSC